MTKFKGEDCRRVFFISSGRSFQVRIDEGKKELKNRLVFALGFLISLEFLRS